MRFAIGGVIAAALALVGAPPARAGVDACGDLNITTTSQCVVVADAACDVMCTDLSVTASCAADLYLACDGMCNVTADASCTASCQGSCEGACAVDPGSYDCSAECTASCEGSCSAACAGSANGAQCMASCRATCSGECDASCSGTPPTADCAAKCEASCSGECTAEANVDCQIDCQALAYATCTADVTGACRADCDGGGGLFCDGQYVNADDLQACLEYLESQLQIDVQGWVSGQCAGNMCTVEAGASCSCRTAPGPRGAALAPLLILAPLAFRRRRQ